MCQEKNRNHWDLADRSLGKQNDKHVETRILEHSHLETNEINLTWPCKNLIESIEKSSKDPVKKIPVVRSRKLEYLRV